MSTTLDAFAWTLNVFDAVLERPDKADAYKAVKAITDERTPEELQRMVAILAVESVWSMRPKRSRRELRAWIQRKRGQVAQAQREPEQDQVVSSVIWGPWGDRRG